MENKQEFEEQLVESDNIDLLTLCCPHPLSALLSILTICSPCSYIRQIDEKQEALVIYWGKYSNRVTQPGLYCVNPMGLTWNVFSTKKEVINIDSSKVLDFHGNPLIVSSIVNYKIINTEKAGLNVENLRSYVSNQALAVMKTLCSKYPYEEDVNVKGNVPNVSLRGEADVIKKEMRDTLQKKLEIAGVVVISFELTDLSYAPEIAQAMLVRQQAIATIQARKEIVEGAVDIVDDAVSQLKKKGIKLSREEIAKLSSNLLLTLCGDQSVQPTLDLS